MRNLIQAGCALTLLLSCGGTTDGGDSGAGDSGTGQQDVEFEILSPADGSSFSEGDEIFLDARLAYASGEDLNETLSWSLGSGEWSAEGDELIVTDVPAGVHTLTVTAENVGPNGLSRSVNIEVVALPINLTGTLDGKVEVGDGGSFNFDDDCKGPMAFVLDGSELSGTGGCTAFDEAIDFLVTGTVSGGQVTGEMGVSGGEENVPFTGTWDAEAQLLTGEFDQTWTNSDGFLRIFGTFQATAD